VVLARIAAALLWAEHRKGAAGSSYREILARLNQVISEQRVPSSKVELSGPGAGSERSNFTRREIRARW
jgi:hypothetical protein